MCPYRSRPVLCAHQSFLLVRRNPALVLPLLSHPPPHRIPTPRPTHRPPPPPPRISRHFAAPSSASSGALVDDRRQYLLGNSSLGSAPLLHRWNALLRPPLPHCRNHPLVLPLLSHLPPHRIPPAQLALPPSSHRLDMLLSFDRYSRIPLSMRNRADRDPPCIF